MTSPIRFSTTDGEQPAETVYRWQGKIADSRWVEFVAFPRKGSVRMHAQCGASVVTDKDPTAGNATLLQAALDQATTFITAVH